MRWFKHMTASANDEKLSRLTDATGLEGYGFWWRVVETVAANMGADDRAAAAFSAKKWGNSLGISPRKFRTLAGLCADFGLFSMECSENLIRITIPNILKFRDEYTDRKSRKTEGRREGLRPSRARRSEAEAEAEQETQTTPSPSPTKGRGAGGADASSRDGLPAESRAAFAACSWPCPAGDGGSVPDAENGPPSGRAPEAGNADPFSGRASGRDADRDSGRSPEACSGPSGPGATAVPAGMDLGFHEFLAAYPAAHREPVGEAALVWKKLAREKSLPGLPRLLQGLDAWEDSHQWRKDDGAYIPKAANFLRRSMWLSAPPRAAPDEFWDAGAAMARLRAAAGNPLGAGGRL